MLAAPCPGRRPGAWRPPVSDKRCHLSVSALAGRTAEVITLPVCSPGLAPPVAFMARALAIASPWWRITAAT